MSRLQPGLRRNVLAPQGAWARVRGALWPFELRFLPVLGAWDVDLDKVIWGNNMQSCGLLRIVASRLCVERPTSLCPLGYVGQFWV